MYVAQYMARTGIPRLEPRALKLFREVSRVEPLRPEPYMFGLKLSQRLNNIEGIKWASLGVLSQAWPNDKAEVLQTAYRAAKALLDQLKDGKNTKEAAAFQAALDKALVRDCVVKVTWTGDADVDVLVEEPSGTVCSFRNPRTTAGGVMLGDTAARDGRSTADGVSEVYVCPQAFDGTYKVMLRRVWGKVTAGKVTVEVTAHHGDSKLRKTMKQQVALGDQDSVVVFDLKDGRRTESLAEVQVANAANAQIQLNQAVLAQQLGSLSNSSAALQLGLSRQGLAGGPLVGRGAVGFQPVIITLPTGTNFTATGVISADRRYVRITALPLFSAIGQVTTFNIGSGRTTVMPPPMGAGDGGIGGNPNPVQAPAN
jgi:hypothetical protein